MTPDQIDDGWARMMLTIQPNPSLKRFVHEMKAALAELKARQESEQAKLDPAPRQDNLLRFALPSPSPQQQRIIALLTERPGLLQSQIAPLLGISPRSVSKALQDGRFFRSEGRTAHRGRLHFARTLQAQIVQ